MTTWNYRIVRHHQPEEWFGLHEVYYDPAGRPTSLTADPVKFVCDGDEGPQGIARSLEMALADAKGRPVLDENDVGNHITVWHEHIFSPLVDEDVSDIEGRFDAIEDHRGEIFVLDIGADRLVARCTSREEAVRVAQSAAAVWRPEEDSDA